VLWDAVDMFGPRISDKILRYKNYPREVRKLVSKKKKLWHKLKLQPRDLKLRWEYRECCNKFTINCREMIKQEEEKVVKSNYLGDFYRYVNKRLSYRSPIGCLINDKETLSHQMKSRPTCLIFITLHCLCRIMTEAGLGVVLQSKNHWKLLFLMKTAL